MAEARDLIRFHFLIPRFHFPNRCLLKEFIAKQLKKERKKIEGINYVFCDDAYLLQINQQYLQHDTYTDIITFELSPKGSALLSDIYISVERVRENAVIHNASFKSELHRVIFHGALHLCGYKDKSAKDEKEMREAEDVWMSLYSVSRGTRSK